MILQKLGIYDNRPMRSVVVGTKATQATGVLISEAQEIRC